jgi:hypothetical protein
LFFPFLLLSSPDSSADSTPHHVSVPLLETTIRSIRRTPSVYEAESDNESKFEYHLLQDMTVIYPVVLHGLQINGAHAILYIL